MADDDKGGFWDFLRGGSDKDTKKEEAAESGESGDDEGGVFDTLSDMADYVGLGDAVDRAGDAVDRLVHGDADDDGLGNVEEVTQYGTNPFDSDTDDDFVSDGDEVRRGLDPTQATGDRPYVVDPVDPSHVPEEYKRAVEEHYANRDAEPAADGDDEGGVFDMLRDAADVVGLGDAVDSAGEAYDRAAQAVSDLAHGDADDDGLTNAEELLVHKTDPRNPDTDGDRHDDGFEVEDGTDPNFWDSDRDGISDGMEVWVHETDPTKSDTDGDRLPDGMELEFDTDPTDSASPSRSAAAASGRNLFQEAAEEVAREAAESAAVGATSAPASAGPSGDGDADVGEFLDLVAAQLGDRYRFGAEVDLNDADPDVFDCSELVQWAANRAGAEMPDGSWNQYKAMARAGGTVDVDEALNTPGALVFRFSSDPFETDGRPKSSHVAISLGDGRVIEANTTGGRGVQVNDGAGRFGYAAVVPEFADDTIEFDELQELFERHGIPPSPEDFHEDLRDESDETSDEDEVPTDQLDDEVDGEDIDDNPDDDEENFLSPDHDADFDGISNDQDIVGTVFAAQNIGDAIDRDSDGLSNVAEERLGTDPDNRDTDGDNIPDFTEVRIGTDPLTADPVTGLEFADGTSVEASDGTDEGDVIEGIGKAEAILHQQRIAAERSSEGDEVTIPEAPEAAETPEEEEEPPQAAVPPPDVPQVEVAEPAEEAPVEDFFEEVDASIDSLTSDFDDIEQ